MRGRVAPLLALPFALATAGAHSAGAQTPPASAPPAATAPAVAAVVAPKLLSDPDVPYPPGARGDGDVVLVITVNSDGTVRSATADRGGEPFASRAADAAKGWRFDPALRDGKPVATKILIEVLFHEPAPEPLPDAASPKPAPAPPPPRVKLQEVTVLGEVGEPSRTATLSRAEVRQIPGTFGDPFRAIEIMPGVTPIVSGLPFFFVRGAPPGDVGYFLDGIRVPYLFHVGAGPSVVHPGIVDSVDLYPGGYPARFGRFSGGIVAGETTGFPTEPHGEFNLRLFDVGALAETPFADNKGTITLGGRYSYTGLLFTLLSPQTVLDYWDYQGRVSYKVAPKDTVSAFAFGASDYLGQKTNGSTLTLFGVEFYRLDTRYDHKINAASNLRLAVTVGLDRTRVSDTTFLRDRLVGTRSELTYKLGKEALLRAGTDMELDAYDVALDTSGADPATANAATNAFPSRTDLASGVRGDLVLGGEAFQIIPGARLDLYASEGASAVGFDPRLGTRTRVSERVHLLSALGIAHQPPAFVIPLPGFQPGGLKGGLQTALQESAGIEFDLGQQTTATATLYRNGFFNMSDALSVMQPQVMGCPPGAFPSDSLSGDRATQPGGMGGGGGGCGAMRFSPGTVGPDRSGGGGQAAQSPNDKRQAQAFAARTDGTAYGLELFLKRKLTRRLGGFLSYTLSRSTRTYGGETFIAAFDRTHVINAAVAYDLGRNWRAGTRVTFYTGLPKAADPTDPTATRLDPFFRLDLRLEKRWQLGKKWWVSFVAEWLNATLTKESIGTSCTLSGCQEQKIGPVTIPSLGLEGGF